MTDKEPTKEQIKEFWEWCGFWQNTDLHQDYHYELIKKVGNWHRPDGLTTFDQIQKGNLPPLDLNNLFKYAVPKLKEKLGYSKYVDFIRFKGQEIFLVSDPALALFWAIWEVIKK